MGLNGPPGLDAGDCSKFLIGDERILRQELVSKGDEPDLDRLLESHKINVDSKETNTDVCLINIS